MTTAVRTLTPRQLNRALLARQMLLERVEATVPRALERMAGLQAQYAPAMYVGLWSRIVDLQRAAVTEALVRRTAIQGTLLRSTIHLVSRRDYWPFLTAVRDTRRGWFLRVQPAVTAESMEAAARRVRDALYEGPLRQTDIDDLVGRAARGGINLWLDLVRVPPSGTWERRRADLYALAEDWVGPPPADTTREAGIDLLVRRYLGGFGPATRSEIADWAGLPIGDVAAAFGRLRLRRFRSTEGADLVDLPRAPLPDPETPAPVRLLPVWDTVLLAHARRTQVLPERFRPLVFNTKTPHSMNTVLVDGAVAGTWRVDKGRVTVEEFEPFDREVRREVAEEADRIAAFHA